MDGATTVTHEPDTQIQEAMPTISTTDIDSILLIEFDKFEKRIARFNKHMEHIGFSSDRFYFAEHLNGQEAYSSITCMKDYFRNKISSLPSFLSSKQVAPIPQNVKLDQMQRFLSALESLPKLVSREDREKIEMFDAIKQDIASARHQGPNNAITPTQFELADNLLTDIEEQLQTLAKTLEQLIHCYQAKEEPVCKKTIELSS